MSRTYRIYNKSNYFRRFQDKHWAYWIYHPKYHPYQQWSVARWHRSDAGVTKRWLTQRRRHWYKMQMRLDMLNAHWCIYRSNITSFIYTVRIPYYIMKILKDIIINREVISPEDGLTLTTYIFTNESVFQEFKCDGHGGVEMTIIL
jgi:predicted transcriptional regulator